MTQRISPWNIPAVRGLLWLLYGMSFVAAGLGGALVKDLSAAAALIIPLLTACLLLSVARWAGRKAPRGLAPMSVRQAVIRELRPYVLGTLCCAIGLMGAWLLAAAQDVSAMMSALMGVVGLCVWGAVGLADRTKVGRIALTATLLLLVVVVAVGGGLSGSIRARPLLSHGESLIALAAATVVVVALVFSALRRQI